MFFLFRLFFDKKNKSGLDKDLRMFCVQSNAMNSLTPFDKKKKTTQ